MPKGVIATAVCYGLLGTLCLIVVLTTLGGIPVIRLVAYLALIGVFGVMVISAVSPQRSAYYVFISLQVALGLFDLAMGVVRLAQADVKNGLFCLARVLVYVLILWYFSQAGVKAFYKIAVDSKKNDDK